MIRIKKIVLLLFFSLIALLLLLGLFTGPIAKFLIEKYDVEYTGREMQLEKLQINLFTGSIYLQGFSMKESDGRSEFAGFNSLSFTVNPGDLFLGRYVIHQPLLSGLRLRVVQSGTHFNYDDLMSRFATADILSTNESAAPLQYRIDNIRIENSSLLYRLNDYLFEASLNDIGLRLKELSWNRPLLEVEYGFTLGSGGRIKGTYAMHRDDLAYKLQVNAEDARLSLLLPFLKPFIAIRKLDGGLYTDLSLSGNFNLPDSVLIAGKVKLNDFLLTGAADEVLCSAGQFSIGIDSANPGAGIHHYSNLRLDRFYMLVEMYDKDNNWTRLMRPDTASTDSAAWSESMNPFSLMADYLRWMARDYLVSDYYADAITISNSSVEYRDFTLNEPFTFLMDELNLNSGKLSNEQERIRLDLESRLNKAGRVQAMFSVNPRNYEDLDLNYTVKELPVSVFNPYSLFYVAFPFEEGWIDYTSTNTIANAYLKSENKFSLMSPRVGDRIDNPDAYKVPLKLAVSILKDPKGNVHLDIPVKGNLKDPKYRLGKVIWKTLENLLVKAVTAPYNLLARAVGAKESDLKDVPFNYTEAGFSDSQLRNARTLAAAMKAKPELKLLFTQRGDTETELDQLASREVRKRFAFLSGLLSEQDTAREKVNAVIANISIRDSALQVFVDGQLQGQGSGEPFQRKTRRIFPKGELEQLQQVLAASREHNLKQYLMANGLDSSRVSFTKPTKDVKPGEQPRFVYSLQVPGGLEMAGDLQRD